MNKQLSVSIQRCVLLLAVWCAAFLSPNVHCFGQTDDDKDNQAVSPPYRAMVITTTQAVGEKPGMIAGEIVDVVETKETKSLAIDENGYQQWVATETLVPVSQAERDLRKKLVTSPKDRDTLYQLATLLAATNSPNEALQTINLLRKHHPDAKDGYALRSSILTTLKRFDEAVIECTAGLQQDPSSSTLLTNRGVAFANLGKLDEALADYDASIKIDDSVMARGNRGLILLKKGQFDESLRALTEALQIRETDYLYRFRSRVHSARGERKKAIADATRAIQTNPGEAENYLFRGRLHFRVNDEAAVEDFETAVALAPSNATALSDLGAALGSTGQFQRGIEVLDQALELNPRLALAWANKTDLLLRSSRLDDALQAAEAAIKFDPDFVLAHSNHAVVLRRLEKHAESADAYTRAIRLDPDNLDLKNSRGMARLRAGDLDGAAEDFRDCTQASPKEGIYWTNLSRVHQQADRIQDALEALNQSIKAEPEYDIAYYRRGMIYAKDQKYQLSANDFRTATELDPEWPGAWFELGSMLSDLEKYTESIEAYSNAIRLLPEMKAAFVNRSFVYLQLKNYELAQRDALQALEIDPLDNDATINLATALDQQGKNAAAVQQYSIVIGAGAADTRTWNRRGDCYGAMNRHEDAVADYTRSLELNPDALNVRFARGAAFIKTGNLKEAIADLDQVIAQDPASPKPWLQRGNAHRKQGNYAEAINDCRLALTKDKESVSAMTDLASLLAAAPNAELRDGQEAIQIASRACELTTWETPFPIAVLALAHGEAGEFDKALAMVDKAATVAGQSGRTAPTWLYDAKLQFSAKRPWRID